MRILVTGGAGFIGSHYVRTLLADGYPAVAGADVTVLDKLTYSGNLANLDPVSGHPRLTFVHGDICDPGVLADVVPGHELVLNFAAESHVDRSITGAAPFVATQRRRRADAACRRAWTRGVRRVVQVSTDEVYGSIATGSWTESAPLDPNSPYSAAKAGGDLIAQAYHRTHGLDVVTTRCCNNYGPYQYPEKVIPLFITNLLDGGTVPLYGDGGNVREWVHVDDHCRGIQLAAERGVAGRRLQHRRRRRAAQLRAHQAAARPPARPDWDRVEYVEDRKGHDRRYSLDDSALRALGYAPQAAFEAGLAGHGPLVPRTTGPGGSR